MFPAPKSTHLGFYLDMVGFAFRVQGCRAWFPSPKGTKTQLTSLCNAAAAPQDEEEASAEEERHMLVAELSGMLHFFMRAPEYVFEEFTDAVWALIQQ